MRPLGKRVRQYRRQLSRHAYLARQRLFGKFAFIHINKCGGTSIESALGIPIKIHDTALERRRKLGSRRWEAAFTFALVRHPYSRALSLYAYRMRINRTGLGRNPIPLNDWIRRTFGEKDPKYYDDPRWFGPCIDWISDEAGRIMVDYVARLETIHEDWRVIQERTGVRAALPHANGTSSELDWHDLDPDARGILAAHFRRDFESFGYSPELA